MIEPLELKRDHRDYHSMNDPSCVYCRMEFRAMLAAIALTDRGLLNYSTEEEPETVNG